MAQSVQRDWHSIAEKPAPAPHLAHPEGCAALRIVLVTVPRVSRSCEKNPDCIRSPPPTQSVQSTVPTGPSWDTKIASCKKGTRLGPFEKLIQVYSQKLRTVKSNLRNFSDLGISFFYQELSVMTFERVQRLNSYGTTPKPGFGGVPRLAVKPTFSNQFSNCFKTVVS